MMAIILPLECWLGACSMPNADRPTVIVNYKFVDGQTIIIGQLTGEFVDGQTICQLTGEFVDGQTILSSVVHRIASLTMTMMDDGGW